MADKKPEKGNGPPSFRWRPFLKQASRELLKNVRISESLPGDVVASAWLGYDGASEEEIAALEKRLGRRLPPSYRTFLAETNGWRNCGPFIYKLWPCSEVCWFRERNQEWIDAYTHPDDDTVEFTSPGGQSSDEPWSVPDDEYFVYGEDQDPCQFRVEYLQTALEISDVGDSAIVLLNLEVVDDSGEWEAWMFANWIPGAHRYQSFRELMQGEHESFRRLLKEQGPGKSAYGNAAQQAALRGETDKALAMLRALAANGDDSSAVSLAELRAFRGLWEEVITNLGHVIRNLGAIRNHDGYPGHLLQLLARAGHETGRWEQISELAGEAIVAEEEREYGPYHEHGRKGFITWFQNLQGYCERDGRPPDDLTRVYDIADPFDQFSEAERQAYYERAASHKVAERLKNKPAEYANHRFVLARGVKLDDEMIRLYEELPTAFYFNFALDVSRAYMRRGNAEAAWAVLRDRMHQSAGGLPEQVAPIILLIDDTLRPLMMREQREFVLSTPRGREAAKK